MLMLLAGSLNQSIILFFSRPYFQAEIVIAEMSSNYYWYTGRKLVFGIKDYEKWDVKLEVESFVVLVMRRCSRALHKNK